MRNRILLIVCAIYFFYGCSKTDETNEPNEELTFNITTNIYNYCSENLEMTDSHLIVKSGETEIINQELKSGLNKIILPTEYNTFDVNIIKEGAENKSYSFSKEEIRSYENSPLEVNLETKIFDGDLLIDTLEEYNNFIDGKYGRVNGTLIIAKINSLVNISDLLSLTSIKGGFRLINLESLENLNGINNLNCIGGDLAIYDIPLISEINALNNITSIGENLWIQDNPELVSLAGLNNLTSLQANLEILNNNKLTNLDGIENIESIEGDIFIRSNKVLTSISALNGLSEIKQSLEISGNLELSSLEGLNNITSIGSNFQLSECKVSSLESLNSLIKIEGNLTIYNNSFLYNWCALQNLFINNGLSGGHLFGNCSFNPSIQDIIDGNCSQ